MKKVLIFSALQYFCNISVIAVFTSKSVLCFFPLFIFAAPFFLFFAEKILLYFTNFAKIVFFRFILLEKTIEAIIFFLAL